MTAKKNVRKLELKFTDRLASLAEHLEFGKLIHDEFDFESFNRGETGPQTSDDSKPPMCGTAGCAIGECPAIFKEWTFRDGGEGGGPKPSLRLRYFPVLKRINGCDVYTSAKQFFGLTAHETLHLFYPDRQDSNTFGGKKLIGSATRQEVAANIRAFVYKLRTNPWDKDA